MGLEDLLANHYAESGEDQERFPLAPDWPRYRMMERTGSFRAMLMRGRTGALIGYNAFWVQPNMQCSTMLWALNDVLYLAPEYRKGLAGVRLITRAETDLTAAGVVKFVYPGVGATLATILGARGYRDSGRVMSKVV